MKLTCKTYGRYRPPLCRQSPSMHFSYKPRIPSLANNLPSDLTGQCSSVSFLYRAQRFPVINIFRSGISRPAISRRHIFLYRANLSLSLAITFHQGAFGADLNLTASNISLSFSISFFLFFIFLLFAPHIPSRPFFIQYTEFLFFPYFFADFCTKKTASITGCCKFSFFAFFVQKILCILILK